MITGSINYKYQPFVSLVIRGPGDQREEIQALVDTGYNGSLLLPQVIVDRLQLTQIRQNAVTLADGRRILTDVYAARIMWDGAERPVSVVASGNQPLLGMSLVLGYRLVGDMVDGGAVTIERLSQ